MTKQAKQ